MATSLMTMTTMTVQYNRASFDFNFFVKLQQDSILIEKMIHATNKQLTKVQNSYLSAAKLTLLVPTDDAFSKVAIEAGLPDLFQMADLPLAWHAVANHIIDDKPFNEISSIPIGKQIQVSSLGFTKLNFTKKGNYILSQLYICLPFSI